MDSEILYVILLLIIIAIIAYIFYNCNCNCKCDTREGFYAKCENGIPELKYYDAWQNWAGKGENEWCRTCNDGYRLKFDPESDSHNLVWKGPDIGFTNRCVRNGYIDEGVDNTDGPDDTGNVNDIGVVGSVDNTDESDDTGDVNDIGVVGSVDNTDESDDTGNVNDIGVVGSVDNTDESDDTGDDETTTTPVGSVVDETNCGEGKYKLGSMGPCVPCPPNTYKGSNDTRCISCKTSCPDNEELKNPCSMGSTSDNTSCVPCQPGKYKPGTGAPCVLCPVNTYKGSDDTRCISCKTSCPSGHQLINRCNPGSTKDNSICQFIPITASYSRLDNVSRKAPKTVHRIGPFTSLEQAKHVCNQSQPSTSPNNRCKAIYKEKTFFGPEKYYNVNFVVENKINEDNENYYDNDFFGWDEKWVRN